MTEKNASIIGVAKGLAGMRKAYNTGKGIAGALNPLGPKGIFWITASGKGNCQSKGLRLGGGQMGKAYCFKSQCQKTEGLF